MELVEYPYGSLAGKVEVTGDPNTAQVEVLNKMSPVFVNQNRYGELTVRKLEEFISLADSIKGGNYR